MDTAIRDYYTARLRAKAEPLAVATADTDTWVVGEASSDPDAEQTYRTFGAGV